MEILHTDKAPAAIGPYAQAVAAGDFVFTSGQLGIIPDTGALAHNTATQTVQALENLTAVLKAAGLDLHTPARSCFAVAQLPKDALVEIEAVAVK